MRRQKSRELSLQRNKACCRFASQQAADFKCAMRAVAPQSAFKSGFATGFFIFQDFWRPRRVNGCRIFSLL